MESAVLFFFVALLAGAFVLYETYFTYRAYLRLSHFDGPKWAPFSRLWLLRNHASGRQPAGLADVCNKYGPIARVGPNHLVTSDHHVYLRIIGVRSDWIRSDWYRPWRFDGAMATMVSETNDKKHNHLRSQMAFGYSGKENPDLEERIDTRVMDMINLIQRKYISSADNLRVLDFCNLAQYFTLDVISDIAFGEPFGCLMQDTDVHGYATTFEDSGKYILIVSLFPGIARLLERKWVKDLLGAPSAKDKSGLGKLFGLSREIVSKRLRSEKPEQLDMLGSFIRHGLTQKQAELEVAFQIIAGADTTATTFRAAMLHVITNPGIYNALLSEISEGVQSGAISSPIRDSEAQRLPYLQAVIREGLRILPPASGYAAKECPAGGDTINGKYIPGGTWLGVAFPAMMRQKHVFGNDAETFRPERWLEASPEARSEMEKVTSLVFSGGKWGCLGKNVASIELNKIFVEVLRRFDVAIVDPTKTWTSVNWSVFINKEMFVKVTERKKVL